ncbi:tetratricopeptide repeat protein [candidate division KSB1 bacterium]|nr:tetratricopeptide repeat protein [candidate division KSB1 bacterium]
MEEAIAAYEKALELNSEHEDALYYLGGLYLEVGNLKKAKEAWIRLAEMNPNSARAHSQLGNLHLTLEQPEFFDIAKAEDEFKKALEMNKEETGPLLNLGQIALLKGKLTDAKHNFELVVGSNFKSVEAHFLNGYIVWKQGDVSRATASFREAVKHSQPAKPIKGILGEGDTKAGQVFARGRVKRLFQDFIEDLSNLNETSLKQIESRYQQVEIYLAHIREKLNLD